MSKYHIKLVDNEFLESKKPPKGIAGNVYFKREYTKSTPISYFKDNGVYFTSFKCNCSQTFIIPNRSLVYLKKYNPDKLVSINCGCVAKKEEKDKIEKSLMCFNTKLPMSKENPHFCNYCESYRSSTKRTSKNTYYCKDCLYLQSKRVRVGRSFEEIMRGWNPLTHNGKYYKLPYLKGNKIKGFKIRGFTYVDKDVYEEFSKLAWVKGKNYVVMNLSKENKERLKSIEGFTFSEKRVNFCHNTIKNENGLVTDHINGRSLDNRRCNLRQITATENCHNSRLIRKSNSQYKGVFAIHTKLKGVTYRVRLCRNGEKYYKGGFRCELEAARHYDYILRKFYKSEYNTYNFPLEGEQGCHR